MEFKGTNNKIFATVAISDQKDDSLKRKQLYRRPLLVIKLVLVRSQTYKVNLPLRERVSLLNCADEAVASR